MPYIIDTYNKFNGWDRAHAKFKFDLNSVQYAIFEISFENGPKLSPTVLHDKNPETYHIYEQYEDALQFVKHMKYLNK